MIVPIEHFTVTERMVIETIIENQSDEYDFWLVYDVCNNCIDYEGGLKLGGYDRHFRNQYTITDGTIRRNWS